MKKFTFVLSAIVLFSALGAGSALASTVTRSFDNATPNPGSPLVVSITIDVLPPDTFYIIDEVFPAGWVISNPGDGDTAQAGHIKWSLLSGAVSAVKQYTITVPASALGAAVFSGEFGFDSDLVPVAILGATSVTIPGVPTTITVTPAAVTVGTGNTRSLSAAVLDQAGNTITPVLTWASANTAIAAVDSAGLVTGVLAGGPVNITASAGAVSGSSAVTVQDPVLTSMSVAPAAPSIVAGGTRQLTASGLDQFGSNMAVSPVWTSSDSLIATVDASGLVAGVAAGPAVITATVGAVTATANVTVLAPVLTTINISMTPALPAIIKTGTTRTFAAATLDQIGNPITAVVTWTSSNALVGTIDAAGVFTALAAGNTTITAASGLVNATMPLTIEVPVLTTIAVTPAPTTVLINATQQFTAAPLDQFGDPIAAVVTWTSSNPLLGSIDANGLLTGLIAGDITITAASGAISGTSLVSISQFNAVLNLTTPNEWVAFSAPQGMATVGITAADVDAILAFDSATQQFVQITDSASPELLNPLNAFLVKPNKATAFNFTRANIAAPTPVVKGLNQGWNLIGTNNLGVVTNELASIQVITADNTGIGMTAFHAPQTFNIRKSIFSDWGASGNQDLNAVPLSGLPALSMSPYDGYWVNFRGSMDYSKIIQ